MWCRRLLNFSLLFSLGLPLIAQTMRELPPNDMRQLSRSAGYIFSGRVSNVEYSPAMTASGVASVQVTFLVDKAFRGVKTGQALTIREWAGLWHAGERYR